MGKYDTTMEEIADLYIKCANSTTEDGILMAFREVTSRVCTDALMGKLLLIALFLNPYLTPRCIEVMKEKDSEGILSLNPALPLLLLDKADPALAKVAEKKARVPEFSYMAVHEGHRLDFLAMDSLTKEELMAAALYAWARHGYTDAIHACIKHMGPCRELDELKFTVECRKAQGCLYNSRHDKRVDFFSLDPRACAQEIRSIIMAHRYIRSKNLMNSLYGPVHIHNPDGNEVNLYGLRSVLYGYREYIDHRELNSAICDAYLYIMAQESCPRDMVEPYFPDGLKRCLSENNCASRLALVLSETKEPEVFQRIVGELAKLNGILPKDIVSRGFRQGHLWTGGADQVGQSRLCRDNSGEISQKSMCPIQGQ
jgi:hypothetical protein